VSGCIRGKHGESGLAVLADGRVAALELEGIDGELAASGAS
jgi:hypothetical protein